MADLSGVSACRIRAEAARELHQQRARALWLGLPFALGLGLISPWLTPVAGLVLALYLASLRLNPARLAGAEGESLTVEALSQLPHDYHVFNQLDFPSARSRTGVHEADVVVAGPGAVFVIEVKHNRGRVAGSEAEREWQVEKTGRRGGRYTGAMRNPIAQVKNLVGLAIGSLGEGRMRPWVQGVVVFSHPEASLDLRGEASVPCLMLSELNTYIARHRRGNGDGRAALPILHELKRQSADGPALDAQPPGRALRTCSLALSLVLSGLLVRSLVLAPQAPQSVTSLLRAGEPLELTLPTPTQVRPARTGRPDPSELDRLMNTMSEDRIGEHFGPSRTRRPARAAKRGEAPRARTPGASTDDGPGERPEPAPAERASPAEQADVPDLDVVRSFERHL